MCALVVTPPSTYTPKSLADWIGWTELCPTWTSPSGMWWWWHAGAHQMNSVFSAFSCSLLLHTAHLPQHIVEAPWHVGLEQADIGGNVFDNALLSLALYLLHRLAVKTLVDKSSLGIIDDGCLELENFITILEHIFNHRLKRKIEYCILWSVLVETVLKIVLVFKTLFASVTLQFYTLLSILQIVGILHHSLWPCSTSSHST